MIEIRNFTSIRAKGSIFLRVKEEAVNEDDRIVGVTVLIPDVVAAFDKVFMSEMVHVCSRRDEAGCCGKINHQSGGFLRSI